MSNNPEKKLIIVHSVYGTENPTEKSLDLKSNAGNRETHRCSALLPASSGEYDLIRVFPANGACHNVQ
jgi:hypothetical protein